MIAPPEYVVIEGNIIRCISPYDVEMYAKAGKTIYKQVYEEVTNVDAEIKSIKELMQQ